MQINRVMCAAVCVAVSLFTEVVQADLLGFDNFTVFGGIATRAQDGVGSFTSLDLADQSFFDAMVTAPGDHAASRTTYSLLRSLNSASFAFLFDHSTSSLGEGASSSTAGFFGLEIVLTEETNYSISGKYEWAPGTTIAFVNVHVFGVLDVSQFDVSMLGGVVEFEMSGTLDPGVYSIHFDNGISLNGGSAFGDLVIELSVVPLPPAVWAGLAGLVLVVGMRRLKLM